MRTPKEVAESWTEDTEVTLRADIKIAIIAERKETLEAVCGIIDGMMEKDIENMMVLTEVSYKGRNKALLEVKEKLSELFN